MSTKKLPSSRRTFVKGAAAGAAIAPFFIGKSALAAGEPEHVLKFATVAPTGTPWWALAQRFKKYVTKQTDGKVKLQMFGGGALGAEGPTLKSTRKGGLGGWGGSASMSASALQCLELPYLFSDSKTAQKTLGTVRQEIHDILMDNDLKLVMFAENGYRSFGANAAIMKPSDLKGMKMRSQESQVYLDMYKALGASPVQMGITEVLSALQTGVIDGYDNTKLFAFAAALYMATSDWSAVKINYQPAVIALSRKAWEGLPADIQEAMALDSEEVLKIEDRGFRTVRAMVPQLTQNFHDVGIKVHTPDHEPFRAATASTHAAFEKRASPQGKALLKAIKATL